MLRARHPVRSLLVVVAVGLSVGSQVVTRPAMVAGALPPLPPRHRSPYIDPRRPECPHNWDSIPMPRDGQKDVAPGTMLFVGELSVSGAQSNVPEFNDCQRVILVSDAKRMTYGPLMAVFATYRRDSLPITTDTLPSNTQVFAAAEVLDYSNVTGYDVLGIRPLFNCLYVWGTIGSLHAKMVNVGATETNCSERYAPSEVPGQTLAVREIADSTFNDPADYPPVARWDWDDTRKMQYIGLRCGTEWCEVGEGVPAAPSTPRFVSSHPYANAAASLAERRVGTVKGWYDQQYLSMFENGALHPTLLRGTIIPDPGLASIAPTGNPGTWYTTSHVALDRPAIGTLVKELKYYREKFNFDPIGPHSPISAMNHVLICFGTRARCGVPLTPSLKASCDPGVITGTTIEGYWSKITSPSRPTVMYRCATYYPHPGVPIPATARWRWLARDETTWRYCPAGCCEVNGN